MGKQSSINIIKKDLKKEEKQPKVSDEDMKFFKTDDNVLLD